MSEEKVQTATETASESPVKESVQQSSTDQYIAESKKYRKRAQEAEAKLAKIEEQSKKAKEAKMIEEGKKDEVIADLIAERDKYKSSHEKLNSYEQKRMAQMLEKHPEEDREQLSKLDLDTLEYVTNKINDKKPNPPEVAGAARKSEPKVELKDFQSMSKQDKQKNWEAYMNQYKK